MGGDFVADPGEEGPLLDVKDEHVGGRAPSIFVVQVRGESIGGTRMSAHRKEPSSEQDDSESIGEADKFAWGGVTDEYERACLREEPERGEHRPHAADGAARRDGAGQGVMQAAQALGVDHKTERNDQAQGYRQLEQRLALTARSPTRGGRGRGRSSWKRRGDC